MPSPRSTIFVLSALAIVLWFNPAHAERRVALVIGNGAYKVAPLKNPTNDAKDMADALREMGFDVTLKVNASHKEMEEAVRAFGAKLKQGGLGLFYYAGHGVQVGGENYLIPVDTKIDAEADVKFGALNAGIALARMEDAGNDLNIVILDACRSNPFARSFRTAEQGLARMDAPKGSLIAYATAPGRVAADSGGTGRNGVYTSFLLQHMRAPGQKVEEILKRVRADVVRATKDKQVPWESSSLIGDFYFILPQGQTIQASVAPAPAVAPVFRPQEPVQPVKTKPTAKTGGQAQDWFGMGDQAFQRGEYNEAAKLFRKVADQGDAKGQNYLGVMYAKGLGVEQNYVEAVKWYRKAGEQGDATAQANLGWMYTEGQGVAQNYVEAVKWYRKAADQGDVVAQCSLGEIYSNGQGVSQNYAEAVKWYRKAADQGKSLAQNNLGWMYTEGKGVAQNYVEAVKWYQKAADQGNAVAQCSLGASYGTGKGVPQNYVLAYMWSSISAAQGDATALKNRDLAASTMTPAQIAEAQKLASQWRPKTPEELGYKPTALAGAGDEPTARGRGRVVPARKSLKAKQ